MGLIGQHFVCPGSSFVQRELIYHVDPEHMRLPVVASVVNGNLFREVSFVIVTALCILKDWHAAVFLPSGRSSRTSLLCIYGN